MFFFLEFSGSIIQRDQRKKKIKNIRNRKREKIFACHFFAFCRLPVTKSCRSVSLFDD